MTIARIVGQKWRSDMSDEERQAMIDNFRDWWREHKDDGNIPIVKPEDMSDDEWEDWEG